MLPLWLVVIFFFKFQDFTGNRVKAELMPKPLGNPRAEVCLLLPLRHFLRHSKNEAQQIGFSTGSVQCHLNNSDHRDLSMGWHCLSSPRSLVLPFLLFFFAFFPFLFPPYVVLLQS